MFLNKDEAIQIIKNERDAAIAAANANFERQRALIEKLWSSNEAENQASDAHLPVVREVKLVHAGAAVDATESLSKRVLKAVHKFDHEFTVDELMLALGLETRGHNRNAVATALGRALEDGIIVKTQRGNRTQSAIYRVTAKGTGQAKKAADGLLPMN